LLSQWVNVYRYAEESVRLRSERRDAQRRRADEVTDELAAHAVSDAAVVDLKQRMVEAERAFEERRNAGASAAVAAELERKAEVGAVQIGYMNYNGCHQLVF
jgi:hypothetical protein